MDSLKDLTSKLFSKVMNLSTETADIDPIIYRKKVDDLETHTSEEQRKTEDSCYMLIERWRSFGHDSTDAVLLRKIDHFYYVLSGLSKLPRGYVSLDASRPWIVFWTIHSMELLGTLKELPVHIVERCVKWLARCQHPTGGFGGGPQQLPHLAPTYAAVSALCILGASHDYDQGRDAYSYT